MNVRLRTWRDANGKKRHIRLYGSWRNLLARTRGTGKAGNGENYWKGKYVEWKDFLEFRRWALASGYSKRNCSLDRIDPEGDYTRSNCRWVTREENTRWENVCRGAGDPVRYPEVPF